MPSRAESGRPAAPAPALADRDGHRGRAWDRAAWVLCAAVLGLLLHAAWRVGPTYDEHFYVASGAHYLSGGDFGLNREHPPLLKYLAGAPLLLLGVETGPDSGAQLAFPAAFFYGRGAEQLDTHLFAARLPFCLLGVLFVFAVWRVARAWFGPRPGFVAAALFGLNPNLLAHAPLAGLDAGSSFFIFLALVAFVAALERPSARRVVLAGLAFGLAQLAKFSALLLVPVQAALVLGLALFTRRARTLLLAPRVWLVGLSLFALGYGFEARSINSLWGERGYPLTVRRAPVEAADLAAALARELPPEAAAAARPITAARGVVEALEAQLTLLGQSEPPGVAPAAARALLALEHGPGILRRRATEALLGAPAPGLSAGERLALVPRLAEREILFEPGASEAQRLAAWRQWFDRAREEDWDERILTPGVFDRLTRGLLGDTRPIPLASAIKGVDYQLYHGQYGHGSYFRGRTLSAPADFREGNPHPEYYAVVLGVKNPLGFLIAVLGGVLVALFAPRRFGVLRLAAVGGFTLVAMWLFSTGNALMGVRYVLPVFPFLALFAARLTAVAPRFGLALAVIAAAESLWIHPHQLMYYNALAGGSARGPEITVVGDDWGQGVRAVGRFAQRHREALRQAGGLYYEPYNVGDPAAFGLEESRLPDGPVAGIVAVHVLHLLREREKWRWLDGHEPFVVLDRSVRVYDTRPGAPGGDPGWR
jgi:4-amino-4-deoxy-L-arabinose transferase-like glycosyltransferase